MVVLKERDAKLANLIPREQNGILHHLGMAKQNISLVFEKLTLLSYGSGDYEVALEELTAAEKKANELLKALCEKVKR